MKAVNVKEMSPPTTPRGRKANYSVEENLLLAEKYKEHKNTIDAKHKDAGTNKIKKEVWVTILVRDFRKSSDR